MGLELKLVLVAIAVAQLTSLCLIFLGIVGGFESNSAEKLFTASGEIHGLDINNTGTNNVKEDITASGIPQKVVLMVIDALRMDMMTSQNFPFLLRSLKKSRTTGTLNFQVTVDSPTVTLPRIKTIVTGKTPTYLDVLKNFQTTDNAYTSTTRINQDNLIWALKKEKPEINICFFGDETWLRLFPLDNEGKSPYFKKWEGVTSFFVKDFYQVDLNVTRNLKNIDDCHLTIVHYLGLDHIGHVYGPTVRPDLIKSKLNEMDTVIKLLHSKITKRNGEKNLLLITGDHGMANAGGHGGSSFEEITTPLVSIVTGNPLPKNQKPVQALINQIDIAPTLASLFRLKIPKESTGQLILDIIEQFQSSQQLAISYQDNCEHLLKVLGNSREASTYRLWWTEISKMEKPLSIKKYIELEHELGSALRSLKEEKSNLMISFSVGILFILVSELVLVFLLVNSVKFWKGIKTAVFLCVLPPMLIFFSSSFIEEEHYIRYFLYSFILLYFYSFSYPTDYISFWKLIKILAIHRFAMSLNQTGDKWSSLPDLNDSIFSNNLTWLSALVGITIVYYYTSPITRNYRTFSISLVSIFLSKVIGGLSNEVKSVWFLGAIAEHHMQQISYVCILINAVCFIIRDRSSRNSIFTSIILLVLTLQRAQNIIVTAIVLMELFEMISLFDHQHHLKAELKKTVKIQNPLLTYIAILWLVQASFFYEGNSNGLATIDVTAGYIGFESFSSSFLIGLLIYLHTYGSPLLIYVTLLTQNREPETDSHSEVVNGNGASSESTNTDLKSKFSNSNLLPLTFLLMNGAEGTIYSISLIIFRNHLFIWSVFVPKLMYLIAQSVMYVLLCCIYLIIN